MSIPNMKFHFALICMMALPLLLASQAEINKTASNRASANITSATAYNFIIVDGEVTNDSVISVKRKFNQSGYRTETAIYKDGVLDRKYEFDYLADTLLSARRFYALKGELINFIAGAKFKYKNNRISKQYLTSSTNDCEGKETFKYNKKGQLIRQTLRFKRAVVKDHSFQYRKDGKISYKTNHGRTDKVFLYSYDNKGQLLKIHKVYEDGSQDLTEYYDYSEDNTTITKHILNQSKTVIGINGNTALWRTDVLTTTKTYDKNRQVIEEREFLNGELNGFRKYHFTYSK